MGKVHPELSEDLQQFIADQQMFFVATSPLAEQGHVNVSPKGLSGSFKILGPRRVAYLDYTGSGIETLAHVNENGRITLMFCAFAGPPNILRLYGRAQAIEPEDPGYAELIEHFEPELPVRSIIVADLDRIQDACGFGVPKYEFKEHRQQLAKWTRKKAPELDDYRAKKNKQSIDGLIGLKSVQ